jgi:hypothetical protein
MHAKLMLYGRHYWQIRFGWTLENRAIQDVWIAPPREGPNVGKSERWGPPPIKAIQLIAQRKA